MEIRIVADDALQQFARFNYVCGRFTRIETQVSLLMLFVGAVTEITFVRQNWPDVPVKLNFFGLDLVKSQMHGKQKGKARQVTQSHERLLQIGWSEKAGAGF